MAYIHRLVYNSQGGSPTPAAQIVTDANETCIMTVTSTIPSRDGYHFNGWSRNAGSEYGGYRAGHTIEVATVVTLYAAWQKYRTYQLVYHANGGTGAPNTQVAMTTITSGHTFTVSTTKPTRENYIFQGWNTDPNGGGTSYSGGDSLYTVANYTHLYAIWSPVRCSVTYNANGGSGAPSSHSVEYGGSTKISSVVPIREGHIFLGWATSATATEARYQGGDRVTLTNNLKLYAVWQIISYYVNYNANGGANAPDTQEKTYGSTLTITTDEPSREGFRFIGWDTDAAGLTPRYKSGSTYTANASVTMYAVWGAIYGISACTSYGPQEGIVCVKTVNGFSVGAVYRRTPDGIEKCY